MGALGRHPNEDVHVSESRETSLIQMYGNTMYSMAIGGPCGAAKRSKENPGQAMHFRTSMVGISPCGCSENNTRRQNPGGGLTTKEAGKGLA